MFSLNAVSSFKAKAGAGKICAVRYPTDEELDARARRMKLLRTNLGRDKHKSDVVGETEVNLEFFEKILVDAQGNTFDKFEATKVFELIEWCGVLETVRGPGYYRMTLDVPGGPTSVTIKADLAAADVFEFERASMTMIGGKRTLEVTSSLAPAGKLFDKYVQSVEGYKAAFPLNHKYTVIRELVDQLESVAREEALEVPEE